MKRSFTLIETLVCISLLGIVVISLLPAIYNGINMNNMDNEKLDGIIIIQGSIEEMKADHFSGKAIGNGSGAINMSENKDLITVTFSINEDSDETISLSLPKDISMYD